MSLKKKYIKWRMFDKLLSKLLILILICITGHGFVAAQEMTDWKIKLESELQSDTDIQYLHVHGFFNRHFYVDLKLAYDDEQWLGIATFPEEGLVHRMEGGMVDEKLILLEYDQQDQQIGIWDLRLKGKTLKGKWRNLEGSMDYIVHLFEKNDKNLEKSIGKSYSWYSSDLKKNKRWIAFERDHNNQLDISMFDRRSGRFVPSKWSCVEKNCNYLQFVVFPMDSFILSREEIGDQFIFLRVDSTKMYMFSRFLQNHTETKTKMENFYNMTVEYPVSKNRSLNNTIKKKYEKIFKSLEIQLDTLSSSEKNMASRMKYFAEAWFEVYYWDQDMISAKWHIQKNWNPEVETIIFNYSIHNDENLDIKDEFKSNFDIDFYLSQFIQNEKKEVPENRDLLTWNKLKNADFKYINFSPEGLLLSSDFDTVFGPFEMLVPYKEIEPYLRNKSELKKIEQFYLDD